MFCYPSRPAGIIAMLPLLVVSLATASRADVPLGVGEPGLAPAAVPSPAVDGDAVRVAEPAPAAEPTPAADVVEVTVPESAVSESAVPESAVPEGVAPDGAVDAILAARPPAERALLEEILARSPDVARARHRAVAAAARVKQAGALPAPMAGLQVFPLPPETRAGPQRATASASQRLPGRGKRKLRADAARHAAAAAALAVEAERLRILTEARRLLLELAFLERRHAIQAEEREHFVRHEEAARARYTAGIGLQQAVIKIQASITRAERELLDLEARRATLRAALNALRDRPAVTPVEAPPLPLPCGLAHEERDDVETLIENARRRRPELRAAVEEVAASKVRVALAEKGFEPDFTVGLGYTVVDRRRDRAGRVTPPEDDGDDILALQGTVELPLYRGRITAALEEQLALERVAGSERRRLEAEIVAAVGEHAARLPLLLRQWRLLESVLKTQAEEALSSAETAYATGELGALDLLDSEHVLFEVRLATARVRADHAIAHARLEGAIAAPLERLDATVEGSP